MKINEIFTSIQGEGINTGKPSIFIRVLGCDYNCSFCDSSSASNWSSLEYKEYSKQELIDYCLEYKDTIFKNIVLTGGNPAIYDFGFLIDELKYHNFTFEIETQGSKFKDYIYSINLITISPKFYHNNYLKHFENFIYLLSKRLFCQLQLKFIINIDNIEQDIIKIYSCLSILKEFFYTDIDAIYFHFIDNGDYNNSNYINKFNKLFEYFSKQKNKDDLFEYYKSKFRFGVQLHKILKMR